MPSEDPNYRPRRLRYTMDSTSERHAVDDYPSPFAFAETLFEQGLILPGDVVHDPCAGSGWMVAHLRRLGVKEVTFEDLVLSGVDYLAADYQPTEVDWVVTNPPYKHAEAFTRKALSHTRVGVALLMNSSFIEATTRARGLFADYPPSLIVVNARKMKLRNGYPSVFAHYWIVWEHGKRDTHLRWALPGDERQMPTGMAPGVWE